MLFDENINYGTNVYQGHAIWLLGNDVVGFCNEYPILVFNDIKQISQTLFFYILKRSTNKGVYSPYGSLKYLFISYQKPYS